MVQETAARERKARDLRKELSDISNDLTKDVLFQHIRTGHEPVTVYAMSDGEPITVPSYMVSALMLKVSPETGNYMFTDNPAEAPTYVRGTVKCFLHAESVERQMGLLDTLGLSGKRCIAGSLGSEHAKDIHAQHKHRQEFAALQSHLEKEERKADRERQEKQLQATLALAQSAAGGQRVTTGATEMCPEPECEFTGTKRQIAGHKMGAHKK